MDLCLGMDCIVSKLVRRGKIWDFDNGMSFDTEKWGRNGKKREALWLYQKRSDTVGEPIFHAASAAKRDVRVAA